MGDIPTIHEVREFGSIWAVWVETPYHEEYIETLKEHISPRARRWDPAQKVWFFKGSAVDTVCRLLVYFFGDYVWATPWEQAEPESNRRGDLATAYSTLHLLPSAPAPLVRAAHRTLAKMHHPDLGGDTTRMQAINDAAALIEAAQVKEFA